MPTPHDSHLKKTTQNRTTTGFQVYGGGAGRHPLGDFSAPALLSFHPPLRFQGVFKGASLPLWGRLFF